MCYIICVQSTDAAQLPSDPKALIAIIFRQREELSHHVEALAQRESALELCDVHIEQVKQESAAALAARIAAHAQELAQRQAELAARDAAIEQIKREAAEQLEAQRQRHQAEMAALLRRFYGPRSERFDPRQLLLFGMRIDTMPLNEKAVEEQAGQKLTSRGVKNRHNHGRGKLPPHLQRVPIIHDLPEDEKPCPHGHARKKIGQVVTEQLEFIRAEFRVLQHIQYQYGCEICEQNGDNPQIELAEKPPQPIDKGLPGPGLLAYVAVSKLGDHLPLYRLEKIFARNGLDIARSTMCAWMFGIYVLVKPLYELMVRRVRQSKVIHTDDTRVPVQDPNVKGKCKSGRIWTYIGDRDNRYTVYEYTPNRKRDGPSEWLKDYQGYLQADAYGGYDGIYHKGHVIEVACWAHARRHFFDAKDTDARRAAEMLGMVQELYAVEAQAKDLSDDQRRDLRQKLSVPILAKIRSWLEREQKTVLPRSPMAGAIGYTLNQWDALTRYCEQGWLDIDNNVAERAQKRVALGRN